MHESQLAKDILGLVLERARIAGARRIRAVRGWIAETEALAPDALQFHFGAHAIGTPAADARLELRLIHVQARCEDCGRIYQPEHHLTLCPACGSTRGTLLEETGLCVESMEIESP